MIKRIFAIAVISTFLLSSCFTMKHTVGDGGQGLNSTEERQWFILFGLVPINEVDSKQMSGGATDYTVTTEATPVDVIIGMFTGMVSVQPMTVKVTK